MENTKTALCEEGRFSSLKLNFDTVDTVETVDTLVTIDTVVTLDTLEKINPVENSPHTPVKTAEPPLSS